MNRSPLRLFLLIALTSAMPTKDPLFASSASENFFINGSFETGDSLLTFEPTPPNSAFSLTTDDIPGWTLAKGSDQQVTIRQDAGAQDGDRYLEFHNPSCRLSIGPLLASPIFQNPNPGSTTSLGQDFEFSFWAAGGVGDYNELLLIVAPDSPRSPWQSPFAFSPPQIILPSYNQDDFDQLQAPEWQQFSFQFNAAVDSFSIALLPVSGNGASSTIYLDNVSLTRVPEPGSALLVAIASLSLLSRRRRSLPVLPT